MNTIKEINKEIKKRYKVDATELTVEQLLNLLKDVDSDIGIEYIHKLKANRLLIDNKNYLERIAALWSSDFTYIFKNDGLNVIDVDKDTESDFFAVFNISYLSKIRADVEYDSRFKQLVTQFVVKHEDEVFICRKKKGDERLLGMAEFCGGHINSMSNLMKEFYEELQMGESNNVKNNTLINILYSNNTGTIKDEHVALVYLLEVENKDIHINPNEADRLDGRWVKISELNDIENKNEWCEKIIENLNMVV